MSTQSLMGLVDYLCDTLSYEDMLFVSRLAKKEHLQKKRKQCYEVEEAV